MAGLDCSTTTIQRPAAVTLIIIPTPMIYVFYVAVCTRGEMEVNVASKLRLTYEICLWILDLLSDLVIAHFNFAKLRRYLG